MKKEIMSLLDSAREFCDKTSQLIDIHSRQTAEQCLPPLHGESFSPYFEEFHLMYQAEIDRMCSVAQPKATIQKASLASQKTERAAITFSNKTANAKRRYCELENELRHIHPSFNTSKAYLLSLQAFIVIIALFEGFFSIIVGQSFGFNFIESVVSGLIIGIVLTLYAHIAPWIIQRFGDTLPKKWIIFVGLAILTLAFFWWMGIARANYLNAEAARNGSLVHYTPWPMVFFSVLFILVAIGVPLRYYPTKTELQERQRYRKLSKEKATVAKELSLLDKAKDGAEEDRDETYRQSGAALESGYALEQMLVTSAHQNWAKYKSNNVLYRMDGRPDFVNELYPYTFTLHFTPILQINTQQP